MGLVNTDQCYSYNNPILYKRNHQFCATPFVKAGIIGTKLRQINLFFYKQYLQQFAAYAKDYETMLT